MQAILGIALKLFGIDFDKVNGWKTYTGGLLEMLSGLAALITAVATIVQEIAKLTTPGDYLNWVVAAFHAQDPGCIALMVAAALIGKGFADIGLAHKHDKLMGAIAATAQAPEPAPAQPVAQPPAVPPAAAAGALLLCLFLAGGVQAEPYFRVVGREGYARRVLQEACFQPTSSIGATRACTSIPLVEHRAQDGYLLVPGEDWSPFMLGWAGAPGASPILLLGTGANLAPAVKAGLLWGLNTVTAAGSFTNLKALLAPPASSAGPDITINGGLKWGLDLSGKPKGVLMFSIGPAFSF